MVAFHGKCIFFARYKKVANMRLISQRWQKKIKSSRRPVMARSGIALGKLGKMSRSNKIEVFTDGACKGNPGPGGWGVFIKGDKKGDYFGGESSTTNNRMELTAIIKALMILKDQDNLKFIPTQSMSLTASLAGSLSGKKRLEDSIKIISQER